MKMKSWKWDHYLCRIDGALATTAAEADATAFQNPWDFGSITLSNSSTSNKFVCDKLVSFDENGNMQEVYRFSCDGWMLVSSEDGKPGATQNLTDECYWIITSYR